MTDTYQSSNLNLSYLAPEQAQKHVSINESFRLLDGISQLSIIDATTTSPPTNSDDGACYLVPDNATGAWAGEHGKIAMRADSSWIYITPRSGWRVWNRSARSLYILDGTEWHVLARTTSPVSYSMVEGEHRVIGITNQQLSAPYIPENHIVIAVQIRILQRITGVEHWFLGVSDYHNLFRDEIFISPGDEFTLTPSFPYYAKTNTRLMMKSERSGSFQNGRIRTRIIVLKLHWTP